MRSAVFLLSLVPAAFIGCSDLEVRPTRPTKQLPEYSYQEPESPRLSKPLPWEMWASFQDLRGRKLTNRDLILGDELVLKGKRRSALDAYLKTATVTLLPHEKEASALRISSQHLAVDDAKKALSTVSSYFKSKGLAEVSVDIPFSLILAYGYGRLGEADQSLAWFSKSYRQSKGVGPAADAARKGVNLYLATLPTTKLETIAINWRSDSFINEAFGRERLRRASRSYDFGDSASTKPFWESYDSVSLSESGEASIVNSQGASTGVVGVILSLSDRFGALGRDTRQGLELALQADLGNTPLKAEVRDVGADTAAASAAVRELVSGQKASVIVGPLLTEPANAAADTARELGVPIVSFSKSENFKTGGKVFRLGATTSSQMYSLVQAAVTDYGLTKFAVIAPQTASGTEFMQEYRSALGERGAALVLEGTYPSPDDATFMTLAQQLEESGADAVLLPDTVEVCGRFLSLLSPQARRRIRPLGTALWDNAVKIANSQAIFDKSIFVTPFFAQSSRAVVQKFIESYRGKYQTSPNFLAAQGFDVGTMVASTLRQSQRESLPFSEALVRLPPYDGVTGYITVAPTSGITRLMYVVEVTKDSFLERAPGSALQGAGAAQYGGGPSETYTYRGNQPVDPRTKELVRGDDASVASGY